MEVPQIKVESVQEIADPINVPDIKVESVQQLPDSGTETNWIQATLFYTELFLSNQFISH